MHKQITEYAYIYIIFTEDIDTLKHTIVHLFPMWSSNKKLFKKIKNKNT